MRAGAFAAVHIARQSDDDPGDGTLGNDLAQLAAILGELAAGEGLARRRIAPARIAGRDPDGLGPEIEAQQTAAIGQRIAEIAREIGYERWPDHARTRSTTSCCTFAQNSGMS